jgi:hypothetical protein
VSSPARGDLATAGGLPASRSGESLADVLERVLDKGLVIVGDIRVNLVDIELLTVKIRLLVASVDKARELGIDWWEHDPMLTSGARASELEERLGRLEQAVADGAGGANGS